MDFKLVLEKLLSNFNSKNIRYALMGGFAMGLWGSSRSTVDLDFLVYKDDMVKTHKLMINLGYECRNQTENFSQYISPLKFFGGIDIFHAFREISVKVLDRAVLKDIFSNGTLKIKTVIPEDIIGFKIQAIYNNPQRKKIDIPDIEMLFEIYHDSMDHELLKEYFNLFEMDNLYRELMDGFN